MSSNVDDSGGNIRGGCGGGGDGNENNIVAALGFSASLITAAFQKIDTESTVSIDCKLGAGSISVLERVAIFTTTLLNDQPQNRR
ncbi:hypothetical protein [Veronia pacifica]|uniref:Uncharacterized protein n=1 Tax=Veronia pacifica TaxID=1080227 RepID=A0A1C3EL76_9GAMM|nr:hypothetical protein [Veronia pacifica]ODA33974.1 hypothetical protein A8L45_07960 [Veronia pacifica]